jgi:hypothetical protein
MSIVEQAGRHQCWTIEIEPSPKLLARSWCWLGRWRNDYHRFTQALFYEAVNAIQHRVLYRRRTDLVLAEGSAAYFFRRDRHRIRITIEDIWFSHPDGDFDPDHDPDGGERVLHPVEPLVVDLSTNMDGSFSVDYIEGVWLAPGRTDGLNKIALMYSMYATGNACNSGSTGYCVDDFLGRQVLMQSGIFSDDDEPGNASELGNSLKNRALPTSVHPIGIGDFALLGAAPPIGAFFGAMSVAPNRGTWPAAIDARFGDPSMQSEKQLQRTGFMDPLVGSIRCNNWAWPPGLS